MDQYTAEKWMNVLNGTDKLTWDLWKAPVENSKCLSSKGKEVVYRTITNLSDVFGDNWLGKCVSKNHPILSLRYSPMNDVRSVYRQILTVSLQIHLLSAMPGFKAIIRSLRSNMQDINWYHAMLQLETGGLALRNGFSTIQLEAPVNGTDVDLKIQNTERTIHFEMLVMGTDYVYRWVSAYWRAISDMRAHLHMQYGLQLTGFIGDNIDHNQEDLIEWASNQKEWNLKIGLWLNEIEELAVHVLNTGDTSVISTIFGGMLTISRGELEAGEILLTGPLLKQDEWGRMQARIHDKARQTKQLEAAWIRMDDFGALWRLTPWAYLSLKERYELIASQIQIVISSYSHISGIIISNQFGWQTDGMVEESGLWQDGAFRRTLYDDGHYKEIIIVGRDQSVQEDIEILANWYENENMWLDWALSQTGNPLTAEIWSKEQEHRDA